MSESVVKSPDGQESDDLLEEDFRIDTFRFMEQVIIQTLRKLIMKKAADIARLERPRNTKRYVVTREHVIRAIKRIFRDRKKVMDAINQAQSK